MHTLDAVVYNDFQLAYTDTFSVKNLTLDVCVNNLLGVARRSATAAR